MRFIRPDPRSRVTDPVGDIVSFIHMFEEKFGRIHPVFYQGTYSQVGTRGCHESYVVLSCLEVEILGRVILSYPLRQNVADIDCR